ncbi:MAG TPA: hypothetical protein VGN64_15615, partial [Dyadobacter sp.]|nr:hypothetical protein [Dyadobacter sp.]
MYLLNSTRSYAAALILGAMTFSGCNLQDHSAPVDASKLIDRSVNPSLVKAMPGFEDLKITTLISSDDQLQDSPGFVYGAQPDGGAFMKNPNGEGYIMLNNHEILFSVSRVFLDKELKPVKGEYIVDAEGGQWRLCSATLATPQEHGFGPV